MSRAEPGEVASPLVPDAKKMVRFASREDELSKTGEVLGEEERVLDSRSVVSWAISGFGERKKCFVGTVKSLLSQYMALLSSFGFSRAVATAVGLERITHWPGRVQRSKQERRAGTAAVDQRVKPS